MKIADLIYKSAQEHNIPWTWNDELKINFEALIDTEKASVDQVLIEQNSTAKKLYFLKSGAAQFVKHRSGESEIFLRQEKSLVPLGISALNSPGRYMSQISVEQGAEYFGLELLKFWDLSFANPQFANQFMAFLLAQSTHLLWAARGLGNPPQKQELSPTQGEAHHSDYNMVRRMGEAAFFAPLESDRLAKLLQYCEVKLYAKDQIITVEGGNSDAVNFLVSGKVNITFTTMRNGKLTKQGRTIVRPGVALSWTNGYSDLPAPYTITASRDTAMLSLSAQSMRRIIEDDPFLALVIMQRQLWQIGSYLQTATGMSVFTADEAADHMEHLLQDNGARIPVKSKLYAVPHTLRNRFTRGLALDQIYDAVISGNNAERSIAGLMIDTLDGVEREHRFLNKLHSVYSRVAGASSNTDPAALRELSNADFARAFNQVPHVIKGMDNLPDTPANVFFYNHLAACPANELTNGHSFSVDSHFISSNILLPKYGDSGQRIVRSSKNTEFWRNGYYARLDNIFVHNPESDWIDETPEEKKRRKEQLFIEAQRTFDANRPLTLAPEGTSETEDNLTPTSPGPFKPGAFLLAARLKPEPMLVPIALANFDYPVSQAIYAAVIKPAFRISEHVKDVNDREEMSEFLSKYREIFRGYVAEARQLAQDAADDKLIYDGNIIGNVGLVSHIEEEYESDIRELESRVLQQQSVTKIALYGSSTFRLWKDAKQDLGLSEIVNLGFGGATLEACRTYFKRVVPEHKPEAMFFYAGDNDIGGGVSADELADSFQLFMAEIAESLPHTKCYFISIKPSPFRRHLVPAIQQANSLIKTMVEADKQWQYIDFHTPMLDKNGEPSSAFYDEDPLHVNLAGYGLLAKLMRDALAK